MDPFKIEMGNMVVDFVVQWYGMVMIAIGDNEDTGNATYISQVYYCLTITKIYVTDSELGRGASIRGVNDSWLPRPRLGGIPPNVLPTEYSTGDKIGPKIGY